MNSESSAVRYEFYEGFDETDPVALESFGQELALGFFAQAEDGYALTGSAGIADAKAFEFTFNPEAARNLLEPNASLDVELFTAEDFVEFEAEIQEQDALGNDIVFLTFADGTEEGEGMWNAYFGESTGASFYTFSEDVEEFGEFLNISFEADRTLTDIEYGDGTWIATFDESNVISAASANDNFDDLTGQISTRARNDLDLVDLEYGDGTWFARFGDNPGDSTYATSRDLEVFQEEIEAQEEDGFDLVDVEYIEDTWYGVLQESETTTDSRSAFVANEDFELAAFETSETI